MIFSVAHCHGPHVMSVAGLGKRAVGYTVAAVVAAVWRIVDGNIVFQKGPGGIWIEYLRWKVSEASAER